MVYINNPIYLYLFVFDLCISLMRFSTLNKCYNKTTELYLQSVLHCVHTHSAAPHILRLLRAGPPQMTCANVACASAFVAKIAMLFEI